MLQAKRFGAIALGLALVTTGVVSVARAENEGENKPSVEKKAKIDIRVPMTVGKDLREFSDERPQVHVNAGGKVVLHGAMVTAVAADSFSATVAFGEYKSAWTVKINDKTEVHRRKGGRTVIAEIAVGDMVSVTGALDPNAASATVTAHVVKDWNATKPELKETLIQGSVKAVDGMTYTVVVKDREHAVKVSANTTVLSASWAKADLANVKVGDTVRVYGMATGDVIEAIVLRDISI